MRLFTLIILLIVCSQIYGQTSPETLTAIYRADSIHTPIKLYKKETVRLNVLFVELQLSDSLTKLDKQEIKVLHKMNRLVYNDLQTAKDKLITKEKKLKRNRKIILGVSIFAVLEGLIIWIK